MRKYDSQTDASIGFFLGINPKLTLRKALKDKINILSHGLTSTMMTPSLSWKKTQPEIRPPRRLSYKHSIYIIRYLVLVTEKIGLQRPSTKFELPRLTLQPSRASSVRLHIPTTTRLCNLYPIKYRV